MRIAMLSPVVGDAFGQERVMRDSTRLLRQAGHQVFFIADKVAGKVPEVDGVDLIPGLSSIHMISNPRQAYTLIESALAVIDEKLVDVVHLIDQFDFRFQMELTENFPTVYTSHLVASTCPSSTRLIKGSTLCLERSGLNCVRHHAQYGCLGRFNGVLRRALGVQDYLLRRRSLSKLKAVVAVSNYIKQILIHDGWDENLIHLVYNPVTIPRLRGPSRTQKDQILCVSRLEEYKGIHFLLEALAKIKTSWSLVLCGEGQYRTTLEEIVIQRGLTERVKFLGRTSYETTAELMRNSRMVVQPNVGPEPFGLGLAEASLMGVPVIASDLPALNEIVEDNVNGLLAKPSDVNDLASKIELVLRDEATAARLGDAGPELISQKFSPEHHLASMLSVYRLATGDTARVEPPRGRGLPAKTALPITPLPLVE